MNTYALDSNIISYILRGDDNLMRRIDQEEEKGNRIIILPIVYYEVTLGLLANPAPTKRAAFVQLCEMFGVEELSKRTLDVAARIYADQRRWGRPVEDADILIAASCIANSYILVTNNTRHFEVIEGLQHDNWK